jgi:hypothetical protein
MAFKYLANSILILGMRIITPIILGTTMAKIMASEKSITEPKVMVAPKMIKNKNNNL